MNRSMVEAHWSRETITQNLLLVFFLKNESHNECAINLSWPSSDAFPLNRHELNKQPKAPKINRSQGLKKFHDLEPWIHLSDWQEEYDAQTRD